MFTNLANYGAPPCISHCISQMGSTGNHGGFHFQLPRLSRMGPFAEQSDVPVVVPQVAPQAGWFHGKTHL